MKDGENAMRRIWGLCGALAMLVTACASAGNSTTASLPLATNLTPHPVVGANDWPQFDFDTRKSGVNPDETMLGAQNVQSLHRIWAVRLPDTADSAPAEIGKVTLPNGENGAVLYLTTTSGTLLAIDAATGALIWRHAEPGQRFTTSSPAADPVTQIVYSYGLDGRVHAFHAGTGKEITGGGFPLLVTNHPDVEKGSSALTIANGRLYAVTSGYPGDAGHYEGHVVSIPLTGGAPTVWNALCSDIPALLGETPQSAPYCPQVQAGIWARVGVVYDQAMGTVDVVTGNGSFNGTTNWGDSVIALTPDLSQIVGTYTPANQDQLNRSDQDLGSDAPVLLPSLPGTDTPLVAVQGGKDDTLRLINRQALSTRGQVGGEIGGVQIQSGGGCEVATQPIVSQAADGSLTIFAASSCGLAMFRVAIDASGHVSLQKSGVLAFDATSPVAANGLIFAATSGDLAAIDATGHILWRSTQPSAGGTIGAIHWQSPIVVNGMLYVADNDGDLFAYGV
jgi:outer membrane protein assembly factor BamB